MNIIIKSILLGLFIGVLLKIIVIIINNTNKINKLHKKLIQRDKIYKQKIIKLHTKNKIIQNELDKLYEYIKTQQTNNSSQ
jgi:hypothetical protein